MLRFDYFPCVGISPPSSLLVNSIKSHSIIPSASSVSPLPKMLMQVSWYSVPSSSPMWWSHTAIWEFHVSFKKQLLAFLGMHNCFEVWFACTFKGKEGSIKQKEPAAFYLKAKQAPWFPYSLTFIFLYLTHHFVTPLAILQKSLIPMMTANSSK